MCICPTEEPEIFQHIIHFTYHNELEDGYDLHAAGEKAKKDPSLVHNAKSIFNDLVSIYILAKKFGIERLQNVVSDNIRGGLEHFIFTAEHMQDLEKYLDASDPLWKLSLRHIADDVHYIGWRAWKRLGGLYSIYNDWIDGDFNRLNMLIDAVDELQCLDLDIEAAVWNDLKNCNFHSHISTEKCSWPQ